jgi:hypothetical protein
MPFRRSIRTADVDQQRVRSHKTKLSAPTQRMRNVAGAARPRTPRGLANARSVSAISDGAVRFFPIWASGQVLAAAATRSCSA